jgi:hypothetical protein
VLLCLFAGYSIWSPGLDVRDGRHDQGRNGIWISHGWFAEDKWFSRSAGSNQLERYREPRHIQELASLLRNHHVTDVFPHLCPAEMNGRLPDVSSNQVETFLDNFSGFRVMPWIGGPNGSSVLLRDAKWRSGFARSILELLTAHPRLAGIHLNVEPLPDGDTNFLVLLDELRTALPKGKLISVAAYPPPTRWQPAEDVHWSENFFRQVARRSDQLAVMMYDTAVRVPKLYQRLMAGWTEEVLRWSEGTPVLLGVPTYDDTGVEYHIPRVENLVNALLGIHRGLSGHELPANYQGVAIYCEWETDTNEWLYFHDHFMKP